MPSLFLDSGRPRGNRPLEAFNGLIMEIRRRARGQRSFKNLRAAILFYLGGLDMRLLPDGYPLKSRKSL